MYDVVQIAVGVGAGILFAEAVRSLAIAALARYDAHRTQRKLEQVRAQYAAGGYRS